MKLRKLTEEEVVFELKAEPEDAPVEGNVMASGDDDFDEKCEREVLERRRRGELWAWASVTVTATWGGFEGSAHLGCCDYADEEDFKKDGYYGDMKFEALETLNNELARIFELLQPLVES